MQHLPACKVSRCNPGRPLRTIVSFNLKTASALLASGNKTPAYVRLPGCCSARQQRSAGELQRNACASGYSSAPAQSNASAVGTLVECISRLVILVKLPEFRKTAGSPISRPRQVANTRPCTARAHPFVHQDCSFKTASPVLELTARLVLKALVAPQRTSHPSGSRLWT